MNNIIQKINETVTKFSDKNVFFSYEYPPDFDKNGLITAFQVISGILER